MGAKGGPDPYVHGHSFANGNSPDATGKSLRDSGWLPVVRAESSWTLTLGMLPA